jgi:hypothetical protein
MTKKQLSQHRVFVAAFPLFENQMRPFQANEMP